MYFGLEQYEILNVTTYKAISIPDFVINDTFREWILSFPVKTYLCITDIARQKNPVEPKDVIKNWLRSKNTLEYLGLWEQLNNPHFKGVEFDSL